MVKVSVTLPLARETPGALVYALPDVKNRVVSNLYVRKEKLVEAGYVGGWPQEITVTVEAGA